MKTGRILLREHVLEDLDLFCKLQMSSEVGQYVSWLPRSREGCEAALLDAIAQQEVADRQRYFFAVARAEDAEFVGSVGYTKTAPDSADFGWFLLKRFWGFGYATEAVRLLICRALSDARIQRLSVSAHEENARSARVAQKCGFRLIRCAHGRSYFEASRYEFLGR
ncbi:MAG: GNAT family N-acetyltransferase [Burkholderiaceae bacterium]